MDKKKNLSSEDYIKKIPEIGQKYLTQIRSILLAETVYIVEEMKYGTLAFMLRGHYIFYLGAWKNHLGIYPIPRTYDFEADILIYRSGKDSLKFMYNQPLPVGLIKKIILARLTEVSETI